MYEISQTVFPSVVEDELKKAQDDDDFAFGGYGGYGSDEGSREGGKLSGSDPSEGKAPSENSGFGFRV